MKAFEDKVECGGGGEQFGNSSLLWAKNCPLEALAFDNSLFLHDPKVRQLWAQVLLYTLNSCGGWIGFCLLLNLHRKK